MKKLRSYLKHYLFGLVMSCWNAGIKALRYNGGWAIAAIALPKQVPMPNFVAMMTIFGTAAVYEAIDYFGDNPMPLRIQDLDPSKLNLPASKSPEQLAADLRATAATPVSAP